MKESRGSQLLSEKLAKNGAQYQVHKATGIAASLLSRWKTGKQKPLTDRRLLLQKRFRIPISAWDSPPE
jgi:transcriptional regulator with XRE-family HTH domain